MGDAESCRPQLASSAVRIFRAVLVGHGEHVHMTVSNPNTRLVSDTYGHGRTYGYGHADMAGVRHGYVDTELYIYILLVGPAWPTHLAM